MFTNGEVVKVTETGLKARIMESLDNEHYLIDTCINGVTIAHVNTLKPTDNKPTRREIAEHKALSSRKETWKPSGKYVIE